MKRSLAAMMAAITFGGAVAAAALPAQARGYGDWDRGHRHNDVAGPAIAAGVIGLALGALLVSSSEHRRGSYYDDGYYRRDYDRGRYDYGYRGGYDDGHRGGYGYHRGYDYDRDYRGYGYGYRRDYDDDYRRGYRRDDRYGDRFGHGYRMCESRDWVYDPYVGRRVMVRSRYAC